MRYVINCVNIWSTNGQLTVHETQFHMRYEYLQLSKHIIVGISLAANGVNSVVDRAVVCLDIAWSSWRMGEQGAKTVVTMVLLWCG